MTFYVYRERGDDLGFPTRGWWVGGVCVDQPAVIRRMMGTVRSEVERFGEDSIVIKYRNETYTLEQFEALGAY